MRYWPRDLDGKIIIQDQTVDEDNHNTSPEYREYMRKVLYGRRRNSAVKNNKVFNSEEEDDKFATLTSNKADFCEKMINNNEQRREVAEISKYIKSSHFTLSNGEGDNDYSPTTQTTFVKHPIDSSRPRAVNTNKKHQRYAPIFSDERIVGDNLQSMYSGTFKTNEVLSKREQTRLEKEKNSTHFQLGFEDTKYYRSSDDSKYSAEDAVNAGTDANDTQATNRLLNSTTYVLNSPDKEELDYKSTTRSDYERLAGQAFGNAPVSSNSSRSRGSNISIGDGPFTSIGSEYSTRFDPDSIANATKVQSTQKEGRLSSVSLKDDVPCEKLPQSWSQSDYKAHPIVKSEHAQELKKSNNKSSIAFGSEVDFEIPTSKRDYQKCAYSKISSIAAKRLTYDPISMQDALPTAPRDIPFPVSSDYGNVSNEERVKCYVDSKTQQDKALIQEKAHSLRFDGDDVRFLETKAVRISSSDARKLYAAGVERKKKETSFETTNGNIFALACDGQYQTSSSLYGVGAEGNVKVTPVSYQNANFMFSMPRKGLMSENKLRYPLPEVMLTNTRERYVEAVVKPRR